MDYSPSQINTSNQTKTTTKNEKLPPIIITQKFANLNTFHKEMEKIIKGEYHIKYSPGEIKLCINQRENYNAAVDNSKSNSIQHYTFALKTKKNKKIVLKTACFVPQEDVLRQLTDNGITKPDEVDLIKMKSRAN
ncbi:hypothetical protein WA026_019433 [Henosepilachna vigintioctopunctata]|uniref:Uncharacterized protein n=1 Tax=Henosepilachna vigintioctopunctata TaxID=420089 RepID=A0AAW1U9I3_9CUCU